jgi:endonuclease/exonuclease/phosphatase (EEP) superfamily protein YafD
MKYLRIGVTAVAAALGVMGGLLALLAQGGRFDPRLDALTHFAPFYLAAALLGLVAAPLGFRGRALRWILGVELVACLAGFALIAPEYLRDGGPTAPANAPGQLKIVEFNAWGKGNREADAAAAWILGQAPDVVVLEEGGRVRDLLRGAGYHLSCGGCAAAILSKTAPVGSTFRRSYKIRVLASFATFSDARGTYTVVGVHRSWPTRVRELGVETAYLQNVIRPFPRDSLIVAGDFNSTPWSFARRREDAALGLTRRTRAVFTWPAERVSHNHLPALAPVLPIDHVYAGSGWRTVSVRRGPKLGSDHYPVVVTLARSPAQSAAD